jgi:hypothetical protein
LTRTKKTRARTPEPPARDSDARLAWVYVQGWRARLRHAGDVVERCRWEWRLEDMQGSGSRRAIVGSGMVLGDMRRRTAKGALKGDGEDGGRKRKSVHWDPALIE